MALKDLCQLARENGVRISFEPANNSFISLTGIRMDIQIADYTISTIITSHECDNEEALEHLIESRINKIKEKLHYER